jgi:hypothetical protein
MLQRYAEKLWIEDFPRDVVYLPPSSDRTDQPTPQRRVRKGTPMRRIYQEDEATQEQLTLDLDEIEDEKEALLCYYDFPAEHWHHLSSALAIWPGKTPHRLSLLRRSVGLFACRSAATTRKSLPTDKRPGGIGRGVL